MTFGDISRQIFEYAIACDTHDWQRLGRLFQHGRFHFADEAGSEPVVRWGESVVREDARTQHVLSNLTVEHVGPSSTVAKVYLTLFAMDESDQPVVVSACWMDCGFELVEGEWRWHTHVVHPFFRGRWQLIHKAQQFDGDN